MLSRSASRGPGYLGLHFEEEGDRVRVIWVMPAAHAWHDGARPGMELVSANGEVVTRLADVPPVVERAELLTADGETIPVQVLGGPPGMQIAFWVLGPMFLLLGAAVFHRRPDLPAARWFAAFGALTAVALVIAPAASTTQVPWTLMVQFLSVVGVATTLPPFVFALARSRDDPASRVPAVLFLTIGTLMAVAYAVSVLAVPRLYDVLGIVVRAYVAASIVGSLAVLALRSGLAKDSSRRDSARIVLAGVALGTLPFVALTIVPEALGGNAFVPAHLSILLWAFVPLAVALAILQHQLLGIRRFVHRGMAYAIASTVLLVLVSLLIAAFPALIGDSFSTRSSPGVLAVLVVLAVLLFHPVRSGSRWLVDRFLYRDYLDTGVLIEVMRDDLLGPGRSAEVASVIVDRFAEGLGLESAVLSIGDRPGAGRVIASAGERAKEVLQHVYPRLDEEHDSRLGESGPVELRWEAETLVLVALPASGRVLGFLLLGPKKDGEVFLDEEKRLIATLTPVLALAMQKTELLGELRQLNRRLVTAAEEERARIARDLHDGPLQKAILLGGVAGTAVDDPQGLATELVAELREVCSRLRPAILDDLGLVPAIEWLLEEASKRGALAPQLSLHRIGEDQRLSEEAELALFRVTQEALNNAVKHGRAQSVDVALAREDHAILLTVTDDGAGFVQASRRRAGFGLAGMRERVQQLGGSLAVASRPGEGTTITARVPDRVELRT